MCEITVKKDNPKVWCENCTKEEKTCKNSCVSVLNHKSKKKDEKSRK